MDAEGAKEEPEEAKEAEAEEASCRRARRKLSKGNNKGRTRRFAAARWKAVQHLPSPALEAGGQIWNRQRQKTQPMRS